MFFLSRIEPISIGKKIPWPLRLVTLCILPVFIYHLWAHIHSYSLFNLPGRKKGKKKACISFLLLCYYSLAQSAVWLLYDHNIYHHTILHTWLQLLYRSKVQLKLAARIILLSCILPCDSLLLILSSTKVSILLLLIVMADQRKKKLTSQMKGSFYVTYIP